MKDHRHKVHVFNAGIALGVVIGFYLLLIGLAAWQFSWGTQLVVVISSWYVGYAPTPIGSVIGAAWGFLDGFIGAVLVAWVYNLLQRHEP